MPTNGLHQVLKIQFGLVNDTGRYLTAESFGFKVNASAPSLKRKQTWVLEPDPGQGTAVLLRSSHLGRYLSAEEDGRVACEAEQPGRDCRFLVLPQPDGRWVLRSEPHGRFFGGTEDQLSCFATAVSPAELWTVHLAIHPQAHLLSVSRRRYVHLCPREDEMAADGDKPWGVDALLTLIFRSRRYCLKSCDSRYLRSDGRLVWEPEPHACYTLEFKAGKLAFKDCDGRYLAPMGPAGTLKAGRNTRPGKDELFDLEESHPQVVLVAANHRYVSVRQEVGGLSSANTMFEMEWRGRRVALKASNGRYVCMKKNGQLAAISDFAGKDEEFTLKLINRPILVLRGLDGFVCHHRGSNQLDTNRSVYDVFHLSFSDGAYQIRGRDGGFWYTGSHGSVCSDGERAEDFVFEFRELGRLAIRARSGKYLRGGASGLLRADADAPVGTALWEY
ncbi:fascin-2 [Hylobates moloch]|uniref:fascin-2 n=1 Tax=Hylobates moloch TaxID=81572 RepID=UPI0013F1D132|nr:fascin-2 [Hylobates moloch]